MTSFSGADENNKLAAGMATEYKIEILPAAGFRNDSPQVRPVFALVAKYSGGGRLAPVGLPSVRS